MNIWLLTGEYPPDYGGGIATYCYHTAQMLHQRGHQVTVFAAVQNLNGSWKIEETLERLRVVRFGADQSPQSGALGEFARWSYDAALVLAEFSRTEGLPEVLEVHEYLGMPYFTLQRRLLMDEALANLPVLVTAHTPLYLCRQYDQLPAYRFPGYWIGEMERFSMLAADVVIYPSDYLRREIERDMPQIREYSRVIANPFVGTEEVAHAVEDTDRRGFLYTAKIERRKGIEPLLSTFCHLWDAGLDEPLFLIGDDWYDELHQCWMSELIRGQYGNYIEDELLCWQGKQAPQIVNQKLSQVRAMILPSLFENYPYAVLEAMAAGCPVIVSANGGHSEIVEDNDSGFIFAYQGPGGLADKIQTVLELTPPEFESITSAAKLRVQQVSGYQIVAPQKEEAYEWARDRLHSHKYFPFVRGVTLNYKPPEDQTLAGETGVLSIVIPFFNLGDFIEDVLKQFNNLRDVPYEIIVIDDGSTDQHSLDLLNKLQLDYHFRLEQTKNQGLSVARNTGAHLARGEFLAFLDADDYMDPIFYRRAVDTLRHYENISYVGCWVQYIGNAHNYWPTWQPELPYALVHNPLNTSALVYRRADFLRFGLNDPSFMYIMEDYDSMLSMLENGCRGVVIPEPYFKYRVRSDSMFHTATDNIKIATYQQIIKKHHSLFTTYAEAIAGIISCNGPGYMYDNPTLWYPSFGSQLDPDSPSLVRSSQKDISQASTGTLIYFALRSLLVRPYESLINKYPWIRKIKDKMKSFLIRD